MTETLLQKVEEKMMLVLSELERLRHENAALKVEREGHHQRLQSLISLLDTINVSEHLMANMALPFAKPVLVEG